MEESQQPAARANESQGDLFQTAAIEVVVTLNLANRAVVIDSGLRYPVGLMTVGENVCWYTSGVLELNTL